MVFSHFRVQVVLRVALIAFFTYLFIHVLRVTNLYMTLVIIGAVIVYQVYALIYFVEKTNRDLKRFLDAIRYEDFTQSFSGAGLGRSFDELKKAFSSVVADFRATRAEKEEHYRYLQTVIEHVGVGLLAFTEDGDVELVNNTFRKLFKMPSQDLKHIRSLNTISPAFVPALLKMKVGQKTLLKASVEDEWIQLVAHATEFRMRGTKFTLVSVQNIQSELEEKEMEAWQNLIRVLTHEIMNSVTPISSLAATVQGLLEESFRRQEEGQKMPAETIHDIRGATQTILRRSDGLIHFVEAYRNLTKIPAPNFKICQVRELFTRVESLMKGRFLEAKIEFIAAVEPASLELTADLEMIEQVLINLLINACHAVETVANPKISLTGCLDVRGRPTIHVQDNGPGIIEEAIQKIFIPFFTTKPDGSGIGLSLSRQIMRLHRGTISVQSRPYNETVFTLKF